MHLLRRRSFKEVKGRGLGSSSPSSNFSTKRFHNESFEILKFVKPVYLKTGDDICHARLFTSLGWTLDSFWTKKLWRQKHVQESEKLSQWRKPFRYWFLKRLQIQALNAALIFLEVSNSSWTPNLEGQKGSMICTAKMPDKLQNIYVKDADFLRLQKFSSCSTFISHFSQARFRLLQERDSDCSRRL